MCILFWQAYSLNLFKFCGFLYEFILVTAKRLNFMPGCQIMHYKNICIWIMVLYCSLHVLPTNNQFANFNRIRYNVEYLSCLNKPIPNSHLYMNKIDVTIWEGHGDLAIIPVSNFGIQCIKERSLSSIFGQNWKFVVVKGLLYLLKLVD